MKGKIDRFNWCELGEPGTQVYLDTNALFVDHDTYQRPLSIDRSRGFAARWSWQRCGSICVNCRETGVLAVFDGQHRLEAARLRGDVKQMPCVLFHGMTIQEEAAAFVDKNSTGSPAKAITRWRADLVAQNPIVMQLRDLVVSVGFNIGNDTKACGIRCVGTLKKLGALDLAAMRLALPVCADLCRPRAIAENLLRGVWHIARHRPEWINYRPRLLARGYDDVMHHIGEAERYHGKKGERIFADGVRLAINKGRGSPNLHAIEFTDKETNP